MNFATPNALILTALAIPIIALYILKVRLRRVPVSTHLFWQQVCEEKPPRSLWKHFRHLSSLLLQLLMLLLLVLAIANPYLPGQLLQSRRIVLIIDNSASMRATDVIPSRLQMAKSSAHDFLNGLRVGDQVAVLETHGRTEVVAGMTDHLPTLRNAVDSIEFTEGPTSTEQAVKLARQLVGDHPHGQIVVYTDGCEDAPLRHDAQLDNDSSLMPRGDGSPRDSTQQNMAPSVEHRLFGTAASNIGITQLQIRRSLQDPLGYEILAGVRNASSTAIRCRLELTLDDVPIDVVPLKLQPEETWSHSFEKTSVEGGIIRAELTQFSALTEKSADEPGRSDDRAEMLVSAQEAELDQLLADNSAWAILPERVRQKVLIVSPGNLFLQKVFEANPLVDVESRATFPDSWPADAVIVLHGLVPQTLPDGNVFVLDPIGDCDAFTQSGKIDNPIITELDKTSPLMTHVQLDNVVVPSATRLGFQTSPKALASTISGEVLYAQVKRTNGKCLVLSVNLDNSDLTFRTAFPVMVTNSLGWFAGMSGEWHPSLSTGETAMSPAALMFPSALHSNSVSVVAPDGSRSESTVLRSPDGDATSMVFGPWQETGIWSVESHIPAAAAAGSSDNSMRQTAFRVAVNLANSRESDLRPPEKAAELNRVNVSGSGWLSRPLWFYLILAGCVLTSMEWFLFHRRFIA